MATPTVYGFFGSFCTQKVYLTLAEKGVQAHRRLVNIGPKMENYEPWYARLNPNMVIPTLDHDGTIVCDSSVIIRYIDEHFEGPALVPSEAEPRAEVERWIERIDRLRIRELSYGFMKGVLTLARDRLIMPRRLRMLRKYQAQAPDLHEVYQRRIDDVEAWIAVMLEPDKLDEMRAELVGVLEDLERALAEHSFVVGETYTLADMMATVLVARLRLLNVVDTGGYPKLDAHYARMKQRPGFPADDIVEHLDKGKMVRMVAPFLLPRIVGGLAVLTGLIALLWWLLSSG